MGRDGRQELGRTGEALAERVLVGAGFRILARRFRCRAGEIDLIAGVGPRVIFVEVKTRRFQRYGAPAEAVTAAKQRRLARVAAYYLKRQGWADRPCRFDVIEVRIGPQETHEIRHIEDAFQVCHADPRVG